MNNLNNVIDILSHDKIEVLTDEDLSKHSSIKIGGKAPLFINVKTQKESIKVINSLNNFNVKYHILGNGTNTLFSDKGFDGAIICTKKLKKFKVKNYGSYGTIFVECGMGLFEFNRLLKNLGFCGLEFSYGIPGSIGGAVCMNAGAYNKSVGDYIEYVKVLQNGVIKKIRKKDMQFEYRNSIVQNSNMVVLGAKFKFPVGDKKDIEILQNNYFETRLKNQPYSDLSFGSVFKRNEGHEPISKIIDELGLKGKQIGGAKVSEKHAGFIINMGSATCQDCLLLIQYIQEKVFENFGFVPELEVRVVGE